MKLLRSVVLFSFLSNLGVAYAAPDVPASLNKLSVPDSALACTMQMSGVAESISQNPKYSKAEKKGPLLMVLAYRAIWKTMASATGANTEKSHVSKLVDRIMRQPNATNVEERHFCFNYASELYNTMSDDLKENARTAALAALGDFKVR